MSCIKRGQHYRCVLGRPFASQRISGRRKQGAFLGATAAPLGEFSTNWQNAYHGMEASVIAVCIHQWSFSPFIVILGFIVVSVSHRWTIIPLNSQKWFFWVSSKVITHWTAQPFAPLMTQTQHLWRNSVRSGVVLGTILMLILAVNSVVSGFNAVFIEI